MPIVVEPARALARAVPERLLLEEDAHHWLLEAGYAREGIRWRRAFRRYLETFGDPASDADAAEAIFGELVGNCVRHAPGAIRITFSWSDATLTVTDARERMRSWPFSPDDTEAEPTHHGFAILSALASRIHLTRAASGGTRVSVRLPVTRAKQ
jgi:anti-sigma regulatory factor (Ser/Thr protein kinase)